MAMSPRELMKSQSRPDPVLENQKNLKLSKIRVKKPAEEKVLDYIKNLLPFTNIDRMRQRYLNQDRLYYPQDRSTLQQVAQAINRVGDKTRLQNLKVPLLMLQVETALDQQTETFITNSNPIFGLVANKKYMDEAMALEALYADHSKRTGWASNLTKAYREGIKYNYMAIEVNWVQEFVTRVENDITGPNAAKVVQDQIWKGNQLKYIPMYNCIFDTRVHNVAECNKDGDIMGYVELWTRNKLKQFFIDGSANQKPVRNYDAACKAGRGHGLFNYYVPQISDDPEKADGIDSYGNGNWLGYVGINSNFNNPERATYEVFTYYIRCLPAELDIAIANQKTPTVFKVMVVNNEVIIYIEPVDTYNGRANLIITQLHDDGLGLQANSAIDNVSTFQEVSTVLLNAQMASARRDVADRMVYDPTAISMAQINNPNPSSKIPILPSASGRPLSEILYKVPFDNHQQNNLAIVGDLITLANTFNGQNPASQGQFIKGNKTRDEFATIDHNSKGRNRQYSLSIENNLHSQIKQHLLYNVLKFQTKEEILSKDGQNQIVFDPVKMRDATFVFKTIDGMDSAAKQLDTEGMKMAFNVLSTQPQVAQGYDVGSVFAQLMKSMGVNIDEHKLSPEQVQYNQALQQWQMMAANAAKAGSPFNVPMPKPSDYGINAEETSEGEPSSNHGNMNIPEEVGE